MTVGVMEVRLIGAKGLGSTDYFGSIDPYVLLRYKNQERKSSVAKEGGVNPSWDETLKFIVDYPGNGGPYKIVLDIMDQDTFSADDSIGQATIFVEDLLKQGSEKGSWQLHPAKYRVVCSDDQSYCGEVQVGVSFKLKVQEEHHDVREYGGWKQSEFQ